MPRKSSIPTTVSITPETGKRGRKALPPPAPQIAINEDEVRKDMNALAVVAGNAQALAEQLGYEGSLTVDSLEDEIRFYQRRTVEASLELGKRLLILKEMTPHGEFVQRIELLGLDRTMAKRFMAATVKFSKGASTHLLTAAGTQTKLLELLVLDDGEIEALENGDSARGITLDDVDTMSVRELRVALREGREEQKATERILEEKNRKLDDLVKKVRRKSTDPWPEEVAGLKDELHGLGKVLDEALGKHLTLVDATDIEIGKYADGETNPDALTGYKTVIHHLGEQIERICTLAAGLRAEFDTRLSGYVEMDKTYVLAD